MAKTYFRNKPGPMEKRLQTNNEWFKCHTKSHESRIGCYHTRVLLYHKDNSLGTGSFYNWRVKRCFFKPRKWLHQGHTIYQIKFQGSTSSKLRRVSSRFVSNRKNIGLYVAWAARERFWKEMKYTNCKLNFKKKNGLSENQFDFRKGKMSIDSMLKINI